MTYLLTRLAALAIPLHLAAVATAQTCTTDCATTPICGGCAQTQTLVRQYRLPTPFLGQDKIGSPPLAATNLAVPQFDPALGTLKRVQYRFLADYTNVSIHVRNNSTSSTCTVNDTFSVQWTVGVQAPDGNTLTPLSIDTSGATLVLPGVVFSVNDFIDEFPFHAGSTIDQLGRCPNPANLTQVLCGTASTGGIDFGDERCRCVDPAPALTPLICKEVGAPGSSCWNTWVGGGNVNFTFTNTTSTTGSTPMGCGKFDIDFRPLAQYEVEVRYLYCVNLPPVANDDVARTCTGVPVSVDVLANDFDRDSCGAPEPNGLVCGSVVVVNQPPLGEGSVAVVGCAGNQPCPTCRLVYTPPAGFVGTTSFTYRVGDGEGRTSNTARVDVRVCRPTTAEDTVRVCSGSSCPAPVLANDAAGSGCAPLNPASVVVSVPPLLGTAIPQANGTVIYTANPGASGLDQFRYRVADTDGCLSAETLVRVEICGPPTAVRDNLCLCPGSSTLLDVLANDLPGTCGPTDPSTLYLSSLPPPNSGISVSVEAGRLRITTSPVAPAGPVSFTYRAGYQVCGAPCGTEAVVCVQVQGAPTAQDDNVAWDRASMTEVLIPVLANDAASAGCTLGVPTLVPGSLYPPNSGVVTWQPASSSFRFVPAAGASANISFDYDLCQSCPNETGCGITCTTPCCVRARVYLGGECPTFNRLQPASLLVYPKYDTRPGSLTLLTLVNTDTQASTKVELRFVEAQACQATSRTFTLTPNDTLTMVASSQAPVGQLGYVYAYAKSTVPTAANPGGEPIVFNRLAGQELHLDGAAAIDWSVNAVAFKGIGRHGGPNDDDQDGVRDLNWRFGDGQLSEYEMAPEELHIPRFMGQRTADTSRVILLALSGGSSFTTTVSVRGWNDNEQSFSSTYSFVCWAEPLLTQLASITTENGLRSLGDDPQEIFGMTSRETGWLTLRGQTAASVMETIQGPAIYAVLVERVDGFAAADLPFERCQRHGDLLPKGPLGDGPNPVAGDGQ